MIRAARCACIGTEYCLEIDGDYPLITCNERLWFWIRLRAKAVVALLTLVGRWLEVELAITPPPRPAEARW